MGGEEARSANSWEWSRTRAQRGRLFTCCAFQGELELPHAQAGLAARRTLTALRRASKVSTRQTRAGSRACGRARGGAAAAACALVAITLFNFEPTPASSWDLARRRARGASSSGARSPRLGRGPSAARRISRPTASGISLVESQPSEPSGPLSSLSSPMVCGRRQRDAAVCEAAKLACAPTWRPLDGRVSERASGRQESGAPLCQCSSASPIGSLPRGHTHTQSARGGRVEATPVVVVQTVGRTRSPPPPKRAHEFVCASVRPFV